MKKEREAERMLLTGKYINKLDQKNRMFVPAKFRDALGSEFILTVSENKKCIQCFSQDEFEKKYAELENKIGDMLGEDDILMDFFSETYNVTIDNQGRISIPVEQRESVNLTDSALVIGMGRHVEIWNEEHFREYRQKARENVRKVKDVDALMRDANIEKRKREADALKNADQA